MTTFYDIPPEIVVMILDLVLPADLENYAFASKTIQTVAQPLLEKHRRWIRKYSDIINHHPTLPIGDVLKDVLKNPRIGYYVRSLCIDAPRGHVEHEQYTSEELNTFLVAAKDSKYITMHLDFDDDYWETALTGTNEDLLLAIAVPLLPGLEQIICSGPFMNDLGNSHFVKMIDHSPPSLHKLKTVLLYGGYSQDYRLDDIAKFSALPSMERLIVIDPCPFAPEQKGILAKTSGVSELAFKESYILPSDMVKYLQCFIRLRSVSLTAHSCLDFRTFAESKPSLIIDALRSHAGLTLQRLLLRGPRLDKDAVELGSEALMRKSCVMGSLREFSSLTEISTDWALLIPENCEFESWLATTLPDSIVVLHLQLHKSLVTREFASFVKAIVATKIATKLPKLRILLFITTSLCKHLETRGRDFKPGCDNVGLDLQFEDEYAYNKRPDRFS